MSLFEARSSPLRGELSLSPRLPSRVVVDEHAAVTRVARGRSIKSCEKALTRESSEFVFCLCPSFVLNYHLASWPTGKSPPQLNAPGARPKLVRVNSLRLQQQTSLSSPSNLCLLVQPFLTMTWHLPSRLRLTNTIPETLTLSAFTSGSHLAMMLAWPTTWFDRLSAWTSRAVRRAVGRPYP